MTGAAGFLGSRVAAKCAAAGHQTWALRRPGPSVAEPAEGPRWIYGDLRETGSWRQHVADAEAIIHCAAAGSGDLPDQLGKTLVGTENLLSATSDQLRRIVHVSSFSVYDFAAPGLRGKIDETTPLETEPERRDAYTIAKLAQESLVREFAIDGKFDLAVIRPGMIYGLGKDWGFGRALRVGRFDLIFSPLARIRLTHVDNCADAIVAALGGPAGTVNIVDPDPPTHWEFHRRCRQAGLGAGIALPVPYIAVVALGTMAQLASKFFFRGNARLPEILDLRRQRARWRPLRYSHAVASAPLDGLPHVQLAEGVRSLERGPETTNFGGKEA